MFWTCEVNFVRSIPHTTKWSAKCVALCMLPLVSSCFAGTGACFGEFGPAFIAAANCKLFSVSSRFYAEAIYRVRAEYVCAL